MHKSWRLAAAMGAVALVVAAPMMVKAAGSLFKPAPVGYPGDKWTLQQAEQVEKAKAPVILKNDVKRLPHQVDPPRPTGVDVPISAPLNSREAKIQNTWQEQVGGSWVQVFAGHVPGTPTQGVVWIVLYQPNGVPSVKSFNTPEAAGSVRIVSADGNRLTLAGTDGKTFVFDVTTRQFAK